MQIFPFLTKSVNNLERVHLLYNQIVNVCKFTTATETACILFLVDFLVKKVQQVGLEYLITLHCFPYTDLCLYAQPAKLRNLLLQFWKNDTTKRSTILHCSYLRGKSPSTFIFKSSTEESYFTWLHTCIVKVRAAAVSLQFYNQGAVLPVFRCC